VTLPNVFLKVNDKKYEFLSGDGSFTGNTDKIESALKMAGAQLPGGIAGAKKLTPSKSNKFIVYLLYITFAIVIIVIAYMFIKK
jgi:hypothetical protein